MSATIKNIFSDIAEAGDSLLNMEAAQLRQFIRLSESARIKYRHWKKLPTSYALEQFIEYCSRDGYRRAKALALEYYADNGGYIKNSQFLFGTASQFRKFARPG